ncbi:hypothetical protein FOMPIDRAFT_153582 [Fomitopsis schrenkii]|uniref:Alcohol acetyltransferase n=1 Tax=Fomitopsis schrenkii TaxID=2126942 RepID=S8EDR0_FOMSC|nr:hypothetical protein FOMPIDRAFT_153582 [Fomitopsis schrenkii]
MAAQSVVREAGMFERWHIVRSKLGVLGAVIISGRYTREDGSILDKASLYAALAKVTQKHGFLNVRVVGEDTPTPAYARLDAVNLDEVVRFVEGELREVLESETAKGFDTSKPLWRVLVLKDGNVLFSFHHTIGDGQSGMAFHQTLLEALNDTEHPSPYSAIVAAPPEIQLLPPIEKAVDLNVPFFHLLYRVFQMLLPGPLTYAHYAWTGYPSPPEAKIAGRTRLLYYKPEAAHRILQVCRAHKASLTSLLHALATLVISEQLAEDPATAGKYRYIATTIPISLRPAAKAPKDAMCNYVSTLSSFPALIKRAPSSEAKSWLREFPWESASELTQTLRRQQTESPETVGMLKYVSDYEGYLKGKLGKKRGVTFEISNVGKFSGGKAAEGARWQLDDVYFSQSNPSTSGAININVAGDPAGGIGISVTWGEGAIDDTFGDAFFAALQEGLEEIIHHDIA